LLMKRLPGTLPEDAKAKTVDCIILKLKSSYPKGLVIAEFGQEDYANKIALMVKECSEQNH